MSAAVRFTAASPCPVCGGHAGLPQGQGRRCWGFLSDDARFAHCTRAEHAGGVPPDPNGESYAHFLAGDCRCGARHLAAPPSPRPTPNGHVASPLSSPPVGGVTPLQPGLTVADLAAAKRLEPALLAAWGVTDARYGPVPHAVRIPYFGQNGEVLAVHFRIALDGDRFRWRSGDKVTPYGLNRLDAVRRRGWALWVEGETDCWSAWLHDLPVLGLPGKSTWQPGWAAYTAGAETYLWQEPGAEDLTARMARTVPDLRVILAPEGVKDLNDAHQQGEDLPALLEELRARAVPADELLRARAGNTAAAVQERAAPVLEAEDPLVLVESALRNQGYGGEIKPGKLTYVAVTSRLLAMRSGAMPVHLLLVGTSGGGKSWTGNVVLRHLPPEAYHVIDAGSPRVLIYDDADLRHRVVVFGEADSLPAGEDNPAASAVRNLLQDHRLHYKAVVRDAETGEFAVRDIDRPGPTVLLTTSTRRLGPQLDTRVFSLDVPDDQEQIRRALDAQATLELEGCPDPDAALVAFQAYLQTRAPWDVVVPFARELATEIGKSPAAPRIMRDFQRLLSLVKSVAVLRHVHRRTNAAGRLVAEVDDYATIYEVAGDLYAGSVTGASERVREAVRAVETLAGGGKEPSVTEVAAHLGVNKMAASRRVNAALKGGWLVNAEERKGHPAKLRVGDPLPATAGLPHPDLLRGCNGVTTQTGEYAEGVV